MTTELLDPRFLRHRCDTAFGVLLTPRVSATVLYLLPAQGHAGDFRPVSTRALDAIQITHAEGTAAPGTRTSLATTPSFSLPADDAQCDLVVLTAPALRALGNDAVPIFGEIRRILKPEGELLLTCESTAEAVAVEGKTGGGPGNRSRFSRFLTHAGTLVRSVNRARYRTIGAALNKAGFDHTQWFIPRRDSTGCLVEIRARPQLRLRLQDVRRSMREWLKAMMANEIVVRASPTPLPRSTLSHCLQDVRTAADADKGRSTGIEVRTVLVTPKEKVVALAVVDDSAVVVRLPLSAQAREGCRQNFRALQKLQAVPGLSGLVPRPVLEGAAPGRYFTVESRAAGTPLRYVPQGEHELQLVESLLRSINPPERLRYEAVSEALFEHLVTQPLSVLRPLRGEARTQLEMFFTPTLLGKTAAVGISHGDFSVRNIFLEDGNISGVIDWDEGSMSGLPALDAISHLCSRQSRRGKGFMDTISRLALRRWPEASELAFLDRCYKYFAVEPDLHLALVVLYWLHIASNQSQFWFAEDFGEVEHQIDVILNLIASASPTVAPSPAPESLY